MTVDDFRENNVVSTSAGLDLAVFSGKGVCIACTQVANGVNQRMEEWSQEQTQVDGPASKRFGGILFCQEAVTRSVQGYSLRQVSP